MHEGTYANDNAAGDALEIEAQFPTVEFTDDDMDQIDVVGDLIRHLKIARVAKGDDTAVESPLQ